MKNIIIIIAGLLVIALALSVMAMFWILALGFIFIAIYMGIKSKFDVENTLLLKIIVFVIFVITALAIAKYLADNHINLTPDLDGEYCANGYVCN